MIRVRIQLATNFLCEKTKMNEKEVGVDPNRNKWVTRLKLHAQLHYTKNNFLAVTVGQLLSGSKLLSLN